MCRCISVGKVADITDAARREAPGNDRSWEPNTRSAPMIAPANDNGIPLGLRFAALIPWALLPLALFAALYWLAV